MHKVGNDVDFINVLPASGGAGHKNERDEKNIFVLQAFLVGFPAKRSQARCSLICRRGVKAVAENETNHSYDCR